MDWLRELRQVYGRSEPPPPEAPQKTAATAVATQATVPQSSRTAVRPTVLPS